MSGTEMTSLQRILTTLGQQEPDRVPLCLLFTVHGAKEARIPIREYFERPDLVAEQQVRLCERYRNDCLYGFYYAAIEVQAFGGEAIFYEDGPPNAGLPPLRDPLRIDRLQVPSVADDPRLQRVLESQRLMRQAVGDRVPIIGVAISPFSLPVMQMGFDNYLDLLYGDRPRFDRLMAVNEAFAVEWANAQLAAGATAICYFDPCSSTTVIPRDLYLETGWQVARRTLPQIQGPTAIHFASGHCATILGDVAATGTAIAAVSAEEEIGELKRIAAGRLTLFGNLNGVEMRRWTPVQAETAVKQAIRSAGRGGGFILSDNHGEIPWQVGDDTLRAIADAVDRWGRYPLEWTDEDGG